MLKILLTLACSIFMGVAAQAAVTINLSGNPTTGPVWTISGGGLVPDGSLVKVGTLTGAAPANATFEQLAAIFEEFGRTTVGTDNAIGANTGHIQRSNISGIAGGTSPQPDSFFATKAVYIWVYGDATGTSASPQGLFGSATTFQDQATAVSVSMGSFANAYGQFPGGTAASFTPGATAGTASAYRLAAAIPETSSSLLGMLALGLLTVRRKR